MGIMDYVPIESDPAATLSQGQDFIIKILEGPDRWTVNPDGVIKLRGRALPYKGVSYESEQRGKTTYYPGNPVATQQIFGPIDKNLILKGMWKDIFLGSESAPVGVARMMVDMFDGILRSGYQVELSWGLAYAGGSAVAWVDPLIRRGFLKRFKHTYDRVQDIEWEMEFELRGRDDAVAPVLDVSSIATLRSNFTYTLSVWEKMTSSLNSLVSAGLSVARWAQTKMDVLKAAISVVSAAVNGLAAIAKSIAEISTLPARIVQQVRDLCSSVKQKCAEVKNAFSGIGDIYSTAFSGERTSTSTLPANITKDDSPNTVIAIFDFFRRLNTLASEAAEAADVLGAALSQFINPPTLAEVLPVPGTDMRDLANVYYGDPDLWWIIADANELTSSAIPLKPIGASDDSGAGIVIPQRSRALTRPDP